ncbi:hypothetical protein IQ215_13960 [Cyanobacterium stanieri LEGE 03274]|uniref:Uncharacterized protein n=1 Tax=Cyanobacterium stanieri LEGE 03274 TaxID=1828756 RepID=A0ABR9V7F0_9CHRO|nr:hypothetical protein [Cyanobacterium stanieri]MBE9223803.1 hypothetical protein [Cyanobacterium stanieri LEGE 03274]
MAILMLLLMAIALTTVYLTYGDTVQGFMQSQHPDYALVPIPVETRNKAHFNQYR